MTSYRLEKSVRDAVTPYVSPSPKVSSWLSLSYLPYETFSGERKAHITFLYIYIYEWIYISIYISTNKYFNK